MHDGTYGLNHGLRSVALENIAAHVDSRRSFADCLVGHLQGVKLGQEPATKSVPFDKNAFAKKSNNGTKIFIAVVVVLAIAVGILLFMVWNKSSG